MKTKFPLDFTVPHYSWLRDQRFQKNERETLSGFQKLYLSKAVVHTGTS